MARTQKTASEQTGRRHAYLAQFVPTQTAPPQPAPPSPHVEEDEDLQELYIYEEQEGLTASPLIVPVASPPPAQPAAPTPTAAGGDPEDNSTGEEEAPIVLGEANEYYLNTLIITQAC